MRNQEPSFGKNYWLALVLSMAVIFAYPYFVQKFIPAAQNTVSEEAAEPEKKMAEVIPELAEKTAEIEKPAVSDAKIFRYQNEFYEIEFSNGGASITSLKFKGEAGREHFTAVSFYRAMPGQPGIFATTLPGLDAGLAVANFEVYEPAAPGQPVTFFYEKASDFRIVKQYRMDPETPALHLNVTLENLSAATKVTPLEITAALDYDPRWKETHHQPEAAVFQDGSVKAKGVEHIFKKGFTVSEPSVWAGFIQKYFTLLIKPESKLAHFKAAATDKEMRGYLQTEPLQLAPGQKIAQDILIYAGPQRYETLKKFDANFENILSKGFFGLFKIWLLLALKFLNQFTHNYGWAIILVTLAIKGLFTPLTHMSYESMKKMQAIQPKMKSIQERYKNDPAKMNQEMMQLYKRNKVNPMGGCLPMLVQIPVFIAFYQALNDAIELKGAPFIGWITDLSAPDKLFYFPFSIPFIGDSFHFLPILMLGSMVWQQKLTPASGMTPEQQKVMTFMPIVFGFFFYHVPSGLVLYWFVNNMLTIFHQLVIKRMVVVLHHEDQ